MQFASPFNAHQVSPAQTYEPLPPGDYKVRIIESEPKPTKDNEGGYLELKLEVLEPAQYQGRTLLYRLNLFNKSQQAVEIAYRQLSALCHVTGVFQLQASEQLHGIPFVAVVKISSNDPNYNEVKGVKTLSGEAPGKAGSAGTAATAVSVPAQPAAQPQPPQQPPQGWGPPQPAAAPPAPAGWPAPAPTTAPPSPWAPPATTAPAWGQPAAAPAPWGAPPAPAAPAPVATMPPAPGANPPWAQGAAPAAPTWGGSK